MLILRYFIGYNLFYVYQIHQYKLFFRYQKHKYLLNSSVHINIQFLSMVETYPVVRALAVRTRGPIPGPWGQRHQRYAHMRGARTARIAHAIRPRILRQSHQAVSAFASHKLGLHVVLPARVRLHSHVIILSGKYSWSRLLEKPRLQMTTQPNYGSEIRSMNSTFIA